MLQFPNSLKLRKCANFFSFLFLFFMVVRFTLVSSLDTLKRKRLSTPSSSARDENEYCMGDWCILRVIKFRENKQVLYLFTKNPCLFPSHRQVFHRDWLTFWTLKRNECICVICFICPLIFVTCVKKVKAERVICSIFSWRSASLTCFFTHGVLESFISHWKYFSPFSFLLDLSDYSLLYMSDYLFFCLLFSLFFFPF